MRRTDSLASHPLLRAALTTILAALCAGPLSAAHEPGYGFYRTVEGDVRLTTLDRAEPLDVEPNYPLLLGDRVWVAAAARLEAILPDQTILRAAGNTDLYFEDLALYAGETAGQGTVLRLLEGEIQVLVTDFDDEREPVRVDTPNATIYLQLAGSYRIYADDRGWSEVVVREGFGEVALADGSVVVRANEEAVIDGEVDPRVRVYPAGALDALEAWGEELDREAQLAETETYVDEPLRYQAAPLRDHGYWVAVDAGYAWRPHVSVGWRPYTRGYWTYTPAGQYWVSAEPFAVTFHYGSWSLHPYHGWIWYPGSVFSPAWVTWYWGPTYVGWVPSGYYSHHYRHGFGLRFGFYGWAGGSWSYYSHWTFCPSRYFGWRSYRTYWRSGAEIGRTAHYDVPRGAVLGSTRGIPRGYQGRPDEVARLVEPPGRDRAPEWRTPDWTKVDVTDFIARKPSLGPEIRDVVFRDEGSDPAERWTRLRPAERDDAPRSAPSDRWTTDGTTGDRPTRDARALPSRPDVSREELTGRLPVRREPMAETTRPARPETPRRPLAGDEPDRGGWDAPERREPAREEPRTFRTLPDNLRSVAPPARPAPRVEPRPLPEFRTREPVRTPGVESRARAPETPRPELRRPETPRPELRQPESPRPEFRRPETPSSREIPSPRETPSARALPPPAFESGVSAGTRIPVVRRVIDPIRNNRSPSAQPAPPSRPSSGWSAPPSSRVAPPSAPATAPSSPPSSRVSSPSPPATAPSRPPSSGASSPSSPSRPSFSPPSRPSISPPSSSSRTPSVSIKRPSSSTPRASRPSAGSSRGSGKSVSGRGSSSSSSKSSQSSGRARSQSRSKSKPPGD